jgi:NitT/TauT family transport system substrate-binding protein
VQGWSVYANIQPIITRRAGYAVNLVFPDDYGVHFYGDCIFTTDELVDTNPDLARRFLRASLKGWNYAVENAAEIGPLVARYNPNADVEIETDSMFASQPMINTGEDHIGSMKPEVWVAMEATLRQNGAITGSIDPTAAYTLQFLREIYGQ